MTESFDSWAIVELMGHVRMAGRVTEEERFGAKMGRVDIPGPDGTVVTQYFGGGSVYRLTPCTEDTARRAAALGVPAPVHAWQLPALEKRPVGEFAEEMGIDIEDDGSEAPL